MCAEQHMAKSFQCFNTQYQDTGLFGIYFVCHKTKVRDFVWYLLREYNRLVNTISRKEFERGKELVKAQYIMGLEGTQALFDECCRQILYRGRRVPYEEFCAEVDNLTRAEYKDVMHDLIDYRDHAASSFGSVEGHRDYLWRARRNRSFLT